MKITVRTIYQHKNKNNDTNTNKKRVCWIKIPTLINKWTQRSKKFEGNYTKTRFKWPEVCWRWFTGCPPAQIKDLEKWNPLPHKLRQIDCMVYSSQVCDQLQRWIMKCSKIETKESPRNRKPTWERENAAALGCSFSRRRQCCFRAGDGREMGMGPFCIYVPTLCNYSNEVHN